MKKNGFTLVEIVVVVALLGVLAIIIGANMVGLSGKQKEKDYKAFKEKIESAACLYINKNEQLTQKDNCRKNPVDSNPDCKLKVESLIKDGLIDEEFVDPSTNEPVKKDREVKITWSSGEQICTLQD